MILTRRTFLGAMLAAAAGPAIVRAASLMSIKPLWIASPEPRWLGYSPMKIEGYATDFDTENLIIEATERFSLRYSGYDQLFGTAGR